MGFKKPIVSVSGLCFTGSMEKEMTKRDKHVARDVYFARLRGHLDLEFRLLRTAIAAADPREKVPSCPDWTADRLAQHVAQTYLHKVECIRRGSFPDHWPPAGLNPNPVGVLDEAYAALSGCFDEHRPSDTAATWHGPDQTVGFWIRRMCHESVVHRVDAELVAGLQLAPIPDDIALDGVDEFLVLFLGYLSREWPERFADVLAGADPRPVRIETGGHDWTLTVEPGGVEVGRLLAADEVVYERGEAARIDGKPGEMLLWLWGRAEDRAVRRVGDQSLVAQLLELRGRATQ